MKKNICLIAFLVSCVLAISLRTYEMLSLTEHDTGFIFPSKYTAAATVTVIIALAVAFSSIFTLLSAVNGKENKGFYLLTSVSALAFGITVAINEINENFSGVPSILRVLSILFSVLSALYFIAFALRAIVHFSLSSYFTAVPAAFFVFKSASVAIKGAYRTVISDTIFDVAAYCFIMLFFLEFCRMSNGEKSKSGIKRFAAFGSASALLSFAVSVPKIIVSFVSASALHDGIKDAWLLFFAGLYIASELFSRLLFAQQLDRKVSIYYVGKH